MKSDEETFGQRVKHLREVRGIRVTDLASAAGVTESTIRQMEAGQAKSPTLITGLRIAECLGVSPTVLAHGKEADHQDPVEDEGLVQRLLDGYSQRIAALEARLPPPDASGDK